jgi:acylphosphatase
VSQAVHARRFLVSGDVQGVGFRFFAQRTAERLKLAGYVRNRRDGSVEVYAIGTGEQLAAFRASLETGPGFSRVSGVEEEPAPLEESYSKDFVIANTA